MQQSQPYGKEWLPIFRPTPSNKDNDLSFVPHELMKMVPLSTGVNNALSQCLKPETIARDLRAYAPSVYSQSSVNADFKPEKMFVDGQKRSVVQNVIHHSTLEKQRKTKAHNSTLFTYTQAKVGQLKQIRSTIEATHKEVSRVTNLSPKRQYSASKKRKSLHQSHHIHQQLRGSASESMLRPIRRGKDKFTDHQKSVASLHLLEKQNEIINNINKTSNEQKDSIQTPTRSIGGMRMELDEVAQQQSRGNKLNSFSTPARDDMESLSRFHMAMMEQYHKELKKRGNVKQEITDAMGSLSAKPLLEIFRPQLKIIELSMNGLKEVLSTNFSKQGELLDDLFNQYKDVTDVMLAFMQRAVGFTEMSNEQTQQESRITKSNMNKYAAAYSMRKSNKKVTKKTNSLVKKNNKNNISDDDGDDDAGPIDINLFKLSNAFSNFSLIPSDDDDDDDSNSNSNSDDNEEKEERYQRRSRRFRTKTKEEEYIYEQCLRKLIRMHQIKSQHAFQMQEVPLENISSDDTEEIQEFLKILQKEIDEHKLALDPILQLNNNMKERANGNVFLTQDITNTDNKIIKSSSSIKLTSGQKKLRQLNIIDRFLEDYRLRYLRSIDERKGMAQMVQTSQEVIRSLERRGVSNQRLFTTVLNEHKFKYQTQVDSEKLLHEENIELRAKLNEQELAKEKLEKELEMLTFTVKQMQRTYKGAALAQLDKFNNRHDVEVQWDGDLYAKLSGNVMENEVNVQRKKNALQGRRNKN